MVNHLLAEANSASIAQSDTNNIDFDATAANLLIFDYLRQKTTHDYKQLHQHGFAKAAKTNISILPRYGIIASKTY